MNEDTEECKVAEKGEVWWGREKMREQRDRETKIEGMKKDSGGHRR